MAQDQIPTSADIVIVGGAVIGSSTAYHLAKDPAFKGRIVVIEKDPTYKFSASALSAASIRQQFSTPENIQMSQFGIEFRRRPGFHEPRDEIGAHIILQIRQRARRIGAPVGVAGVERRRTLGTPDRARGGSAPIQHSPLRPR